MYIPAEFDVKDIARLHQIIRENNFGMLVSMVDGVAFATHLPFMIAPESRPHGTLLVHMARANPHWRSFGDEEVLVTFTGPHRYISPSWYQAGNAVPTWNYIAVHTYGVPALVEDAAATVEYLRQLVDTHESCFETPWSLEALEWVRDEPETAKLIIRICLAVAESNGDTSLTDQIEIVTLCSRLGVEPSEYGIYHEDLLEQLKLKTRAD